MIAAETVQEPGVGFEFGRASVELAHMTQLDPCPPMHGPDDPANVHIHIAIFAQLAYLVAVFAEAHDGEAALIVWGFRRANVQVASSTRKLHHFVDMR